MCTLDKISENLKKQHKSQKDLTDYLGITKNAFTNWKSGQSKSYQKYLPKIAEFLDVPIDSLLDDEDTPAVNHEQLVQDKINFLRAREFDNLKIALYGDTSIDDSVINDVKEMAIKLYIMKNFQK